MKKGFESVETTDLIARIMLAEARGEGDEGMEMVGAVIANRVIDGRFGTGWRGVCLKRGAFSCFSEAKWNKANLEVMHKRAGAHALALATMAMRGHTDALKGATHYCNPNGMSKKMLRKWLSWAANGQMVGCGSVGKHILFRET